MTHASKDPIASVDGHPQFTRPEDLGKRTKPAKCLWLALGKIWLKWTRNNMNDIFQKYRHFYAVSVNFDDLVVLDTDDKAREFDGRFRLSSGGVDWNRVRRDTGKKGIFVGRRALIDTFDGYDISSAAIWDASCILDWQEVDLPNIPMKTVVDRRALGLARFANSVARSQAQKDRRDNDDTTSSGQTSTKKTVRFAVNAEKSAWMKETI